MASSTSPPHPSLAEERSVGAETLGAMVLGATRRHTGVAMRVRADGAVVEWSFDELGRRVRDLARGLAALGIAAGDRVAVLSNTRPEWTLADFAILCAGGVSVPVYQTSSPEEAQYVLAHAGARAVICEDAGQVAKVASVRDGCPELEHVIAIEPVAGTPSLDDVAARAIGVDEQLVDERVAATRPEDVATIVYTSGTTGPPKGCLLTHANCIATMELYERRLELSGTAVIFLFLPLAHALARITQMVGIDVGGTLAFWSRDPAKLLDDIADARPTHVPSVPRLFEKIHTRAQAGVEDAGAVKRAIFRWAIAIGRRGRAAERAGHVRLPLRAAVALADRAVLSKVRDLFGGRVELALTGAAPIAEDVLDFFDACGVLILEGYGMTETCAAATLNTVESFRFGTVGRPLPSVEVRVAGDGEILVRGPNVFRGYHRDDEATDETMDGDWIRTGDLGSIDADGFVRITGRKKDLIITSSGKNVTPANIEAALRESRWIGEAVVYGDGHPYLVALVTLDPEEAPALATEAGMEGAEVKALAADPRVHAVLGRDVDAANARFARIEQIKRFGVLDHDLTLDAGELTPTMKVKRAIVGDRYRAEFEVLYRDAA